MLSFCPNVRCGISQSRSLPSTTSSTSASSSSAMSTEHAFSAHAIVIPGSSAGVSGKGEISGFLVGALVRADLFHVNVIPCLSANTRRVCSSLELQLLIVDIMESGIRSSLNCLLFMIFPVCREKNLYVPWRFPVGPRQTVGWVLGVRAFDGTGSSYTSQ